MVAAVREIVEERVYEEPIDDIDDGDEFIEVDPESEEFVHELVLRSIIFAEAFCDIKLHAYQKDLAYRTLQSVLLNDGAEITALWSRQSGKSTVLAVVIVAMMILLPKLARAYPEHFGQFSKGFWVGVFAPTEEQAYTIWSKVYEFLTCKHGREILADEDIEDVPQKEGSKVKVVRLVNNGSLCRMQTANPKAQIESKTYHFVLLDESQDCDSEKAKKSIFPMLASTNGTKVFTGTPTRKRNFFYDSIQANKRRQIKRGARQNHFQYDWKVVVKFNSFYRKYIAGEKERIGEDSDEFRMAYACQWLLEQGMFVTEESLDYLGDPNMDIVPWFMVDKVVAGIDPARTKDSTVVTVMWVDWANPDPYGYCQHRILNWLEIHNKPWEEQYAKILEFLSRYNVAILGVDGQGMGGPVGERIAHEMPWCDVRILGSNPSDQEVRWKRLKALIERRMFVYPAGRKTKRLRSYKRFRLQFEELETVYSGKFMLAQAPEVVNAFDDYCDSAAVACAVTDNEDFGVVQQIDSPFHTRRRRAS